MIALADVAVTVKDAKLSATWWQENVGFAVHTIGRPGSHAIMVAPPGDRFVLHLCEGFAPPDPGNSGIAFVTDEIDALVGRMQRAGVRFPEPLTKQAWGSSAKFEDPDGNIFWLLGAPRSFIRTEAARRATSPPSPAREGGRIGRPKASGRRLRGASGHP